MPPSSLTAGAASVLRWYGLACVAFSLAPGASFACATCGCSLNADAATGYSALPGWRINLEYDYINQDQLRFGTATATPAQVVNNPSNPYLGGGEIEKGTINRYLTVGLGYAPTSEWNFNLQVPYVMRTHTTYGQQSAPYNSAETAPDQISGSHFSELGDLKLVAAYQGFLATHTLGVQLGIKLPTGHYGTSVNFATGRNAGAPLDASLQPGTGSTDLIIGGYYYQAVGQNVDAFFTGQFQSAVQHRQNQPGNDYRPGNTASLSLGLRYEAHPNWIPQLQLNLTRKTPDQGALADVPDTAGTVAYLSPGMTLSVVRNLRGFVFVQVPVYNQLDGYQVFPRWTATAGASYAF